MRLAVLRNTPALSGQFQTEERKMNHCGIHQKNTFASSCEEMRSSVSVSVSFDNGVPMVCPKPRRLSLFSATVNEPVRPLRWQMCHQPEGYESKAGPELLDIIFSKSGGYGAPDQTCTQVASSPPFFSGSPPSRVSNPLIQDARFGDDKISPVSPRSMIPNTSSSGMPSSPSSSSRKGGCLLSNFGNKPAVRIEGFDCLDRDNRRNCSIPTLA
ncbi:hypothetical protein L1987_16627 [Smallanthus sonchifolius]|uniref:Uncharacterized protein n=1 Tax=Smallanthus sonchifolius TaxID=185202 RepID=A0ACB9IUJ4_9ASTR|nr:hypothetical protein L1987_16627 [Smallanthus sonchifolius]